MAQWFKEYEAFLLKNASQISSIETTLRTFTYILPGRFHDAELASEACKLFDNSSESKLIRDGISICGNQPFGFIS
jgi:hypothetical protein